MDSNIHIEALGAASMCRVGWFDTFDTGAVVFVKVNKSYLKEENDRRKNSDTNFLTISHRM